MQLKENIKKFKRKYYLNLTIKGVLLATSLVVSAFVLLNAIEYFAQMNSTGRTVFFFTYFAVSGTAVYVLMIHPALKMLSEARQLSDEEAALLIGKHFPSVSDKLLNTLQLLKLNGEKQSDLISAGIHQKSELLATTDFSSAIDLKENRKYLRFIIPPFLIGIGILLFVPQLFTESTPRLLQYDKEFVPKAPFEFKIENDSLQTFKNEDFELQLKIEGNAIPSAVYLLTADGRKLRMAQKSSNKFSYNFTKIQKSIQFHFEASGFRSQKEYLLDVVSRPQLKNFTLALAYPAYIKKSAERVENTGNIIIPEGTKVTWDFNTLYTDSLTLVFENGNSIVPQLSAKDVFTASRVFRTSESYRVALKNQFSTNKETIEYLVSVVPDEYPSINVRQYEDTILYDRLFLSGSISDDYGISALNFRYKVTNKLTPNGDKSFAVIPVQINDDAGNQNFFYQVSLPELKVDLGSQIEYYMEVYDNDGVNGKKMSRTGIFQFNIPTKEEVKQNLAQSSKEAEKKIDNTLNKAREVKKDIKEVQDRLKGKKKLDWQDKQQIEKMLENKKDMDKAVEQLQEQTQQLSEKQQQFDQLRNEKIAEKAKELQKLMNELLDDDTKKLYEELNKLVEQNIVSEELQKMLEKIEIKQQNLERELDRALELFKKLKFDMKADQLKEDLKDLAKQQEDLAKETEETKKSELDDVENRQKSINQQFDILKKDLESLDKMNQELDQNQEKTLQEVEEMSKEADKHQENSSQQLQQNKKKQAAESQKKSAEQMNQMAKKIEEMQASSEQETIQENYDDLRQILDNLLTLSFDQEELMKAFRAIKRIDPKFVKLSQDQLKLKDNAKIIEDSLIALSKRVFTLESVVTREVSSMNKYMDEATEEIRKRVPETASSKQQFAMTSINNLALLLNDLLQQMQEQMQSMGMGQPKNMSQKSKGSSPKMSELQQQLNQKIENLKKSGKQGRELSEELAKLASEQEAIRRAIKQQQQGKKPGQGKGQGSGSGESGESGEGGENGENGKDGKDGAKPGEKQGKNSEKGEGGEKDGGNGVSNLMEETEKDLVNKKIDDELLRRQKEILTRLLESEKAQRERDEDNKREAERAKDKQNDAPKQFEEYIKLKEKQTELLKTVPPALHPYYKKQVNEYFKKVK
jgi:hypothetical protein